MFTTIVLEDRFLIQLGNNLGKTIRVDDSFNLSHNCPIARVLVNIDTEDRLVKSMDIKVHRAIHT
jgi:hypothetical protein